MMVPLVSGVMGAFHLRVEPCMVDRNNVARADMQEVTD